MMKLFMREKEVLEATALTRSTMRRAEKAGTFPHRVQLTPNTVGWPADEVEAWKRTRPRAGEPRRDNVSGNDSASDVGIPISFRDVLHLQAAGFLLQQTVRMLDRADVELGAAQDRETRAWAALGHHRAR
jgi:prophage regulatory protein